MSKFITILFSLFMLTHHCYGTDYIKLAGKARSEFCQKMKKEKNMYAIGTGGAMMDDVKTVFIHFFTSEHLTLEDARKLYVEMVEVFLKRINDDKQLRPYLHTYPFTVKNFELIVAFQGRNNRENDKGCIDLIYHKEDADVIFYSTYDKSARDYNDVHQEPYEEAKKIVQNQGYLDQISYMPFPKKKIRR